MSEIRTNWPWDSFPEDLSTWESCVKRHQQAIDEIERLQQRIEELEQEKEKAQLAEHEAE